MSPWSWIGVQGLLALGGILARPINAMRRLPAAARALGARLIAGVLGIKRDPNDTDGDGQFG